MFKLFIEGKAKKKYPATEEIWKIQLQDHEDVFFVNTDLNCVFRISLIGFLSVNNVPLDFSAEIPKSSCFCTRRYFQKGFLFLVSILILIVNWQDSRLSITPMFHSD